MTLIPVFRGAMAALLCTAMPAALAAELPSPYWPQYRGLGGYSIAAGQSLPRTFGPGRNVRWKIATPGGHSSPCISGDRIYLARTGGFLTGLDAKTGKAHFEPERLGVAGEYYSTPVAVGDHVLICAEPGTAFGIKANDRLEIIARNEIGESLKATPAVVEHQICLRGQRDLWAFGEQA